MCVYVCAPGGLAAPGWAAQVWLVATENLPWVWLDKCSICVLELVITV